MMYNVKAEAELKAVDEFLFRKHNQITFKLAERLHFIEKSSKRFYGIRPEKIEYNVNINILHFHFLHMNSILFSRYFLLTFHKRLSSL